MSEPRYADNLSTTAQENGWDIVTPGPRDIFIDIDDEVSLRRYKRTMEVLERNGMTFTEVKQTISPKRGNIHIYVRAPWPLDDMQRIAWQACFGSDRTREALSILRAQFPKEDRPVTAFYEKREEAA